MFYEPPREIDIEVLHLGCRPDKDILRAYLVIVSRPGISFICSEFKTVTLGNTVGILDLQLELNLVR